MPNSRKIRAYEIKKIKNDINNARKEIETLKSKLLNRMLIVNRERYKFELAFKRKRSELSVALLNYQFFTFIDSLIQKVSLAEEIEQRKKELETLRILIRFIERK